LRYLKSGAQGNCLSRHGLATALTLPIVVGNVIIKKISTLRDENVPFKLLYKPRNFGSILKFYFDSTYTRVKKVTPNFIQKLGLILN
jgi:hypothetical protein